MVTKEFITGLPKAELHLHLEGTLEPDLKLELSQKNKVDIGQTTIEEVQASYQFNDLTSFLGVYYPAMNVLQTSSDFYQLAMAYLARAQQNGVRYVEMFFDPQAHTSRGVSFDTMMEGYTKAVEVSQSRFGIKSQLIMCFLRDMTEESALEHYEMARPYFDQIVGIGLDSDERDNPPTKFAKIFAQAKQDGFKITMHCDIDQKDSIQHIHDVLHVIGVDRIDHGTNIVEDPELVAYVRDKGIGFTCCPVSNSFVTSDMKGKEMQDLLNQGVKITVNSDDPAYFQSYIANDYYALAQKMNLSQEEVVQIARNSFDIAWISDAEKAAYQAEIDAYLAKQA